MKEKNLPFISVIVPFYNIEECVEYCLDSLVNQDYEGEYEILCVDDGSTDGTAAALDAYAKSHHLVRVLHKPNGGQSDARNYGVEHATGEYISFVDGDDIVSPYYLSSLADGLKYGDDVLVAGVHKRINASGVNSVSWTRPSGVSLVDKSEFLREICFQRILASVWGRLAKKTFFLAHPNPVGRVYEDTYITGEYLTASPGVALVDAPIYGYVARDESTVHPKRETYDRCEQYFEAIEHFSDLASCYFQLESEEQVVFTAIEYSRLWRRLDVVADLPQLAKSRQRDIELYVKSHLPQIAHSNNVCKGNKIRLFLLASSRDAYRFFFSVYDKLFRGIS